MQSYKNAPYKDHPWGTGSSGWRRPLSVGASGQSGYLITMPGILTTGPYSIEPGQAVEVLLSDGILRHAFVEAISTAGGVNTTALLRNIDPPAAGNPGGVAMVRFSPLGGSNRVLGRNLRLADIATANIETATVQTLRVMTSSETTGSFRISNQSGGFGARAQLGMPSTGSQLTGSHLYLETYARGLRILESGASNRGVELDLTGIEPNGRAALVHTGNFNGAGFARTDGATFTGTVRLNNAVSSTTGGRIIFQRPAQGAQTVGDYILEIQQNAFYFYESGGTGRGVRIGIATSQPNAASVVYHTGNLNVSDYANKTDSNVVFAGNVRARNLSATHSYSSAGQGGYICWNVDPGGGRMTFLNDRGTGPGGFDFYNGTGNGATMARRATIDPNGVYTSLSDERLKSTFTDIPLTDALQFVRDVQPGTFRWLDSKVEDIGFKAQQVRKYQPLLVRSDGSAKGTLSMAYSKVSVLHHTVLAHVLDEVDSLKGRVDALEKR